MSMISGQALTTAKKQKSGERKAERKRDMVAPQGDERAPGNCRCIALRATCGQRAV